MCGGGDNDGVRILNLTQHYATAEQIADGVVEPSEMDKGMIKDALTFTARPSLCEVQSRAEMLALYAAGGGYKAAMIGGAPYLMAALDRELTARRVMPVYAFTLRESAEETLADGSVRKVTQSRFDGFVGAEHLV
ncbi:MAG: hypothetical protein Q9M13_06240 [Mariprofundales bacterium]|nr:hypothetical protein [Mariprofundales bacterium]